MATVLGSFYHEHIDMKTTPKQPIARLYHVTKVENRDAIFRDALKAKAGSWHDVKWKPRVFFATTRMAAYEIANNFIHERRGVYLFILVDSTKVTGHLRPDRDYDQGMWTATDVSPEAIVGVEDVNEDFFEAEEFLAYMGVDFGR